MKSQITYNERSWAIDLISEINKFDNRFEKQCQQKCASKTHFGDDRHSTNTYSMEGPDSICRVGYSKDDALTVTGYEIRCICDRIRASVARTQGEL